MASTGVADSFEGDAAARGSEAAERRSRQTSAGVVVARCRLLRHISAAQGMLSYIVSSDILVLKLISVLVFILFSFL